MPHPTGRSEYLHFRVPLEMRRVVERISAARGASLAQTCRDLILDSPEYQAFCHEGHPIVEAWRPKPQGYPFVGAWESSDGTLSRRVKSDPREGSDG